MTKTASYSAIIFLVLLSSCTKKLTDIENKPDESIAATYTTMKDIAYGPDAEQNMDIYLSKEANIFGRHNYTIVFLHGGGYYVSDKSKEERYIVPYLRKGLNVVNLNYRLKRGIPMATIDLTNALNFLKAHNHQYNLNLGRVILTGFSAGAHIATLTGVSQNNPEYPDKLNEGIAIRGIINFAGPVDGLGIVEKIFSDSDMEIMSKIGKALFPSSEGYESEEKIAVYEPITYFDRNDPPVLIWYGGKDDQVPPETFEKFVSMATRRKDVLIYKPEGQHSPNLEEMESAYADIFNFLDRL